MDNPLASIQERFSIIDLNGKFYLLDNAQIKEAMDGEGTVKYYAKPEGNLLLKRFIANSTFGLSDRQVNDLINDFWISPNTQEYDRVTFDPRSQGKNVLNFWRPHGVNPKQGDYATIGDLIFNIICAGNEEHYQYLCAFLAHMLQKPEMKPDVAIILIGGQGSGKGMFYRLLKKIWPHTMLQVHDIDDVVGRFTSALERTLGVWMDEALFTHDRRSMERLKAAISEDEIRVEEKFEPKRTIKSLHRWFAATNNNHFANIDADERRFFFLRVSDKHQQDHKYFAKYLEALEDGVSVPAFIYELFNVDISDFNIHMRPAADEHGEQKLKSLVGVKRYLYDVLQAGAIPETRLRCEREWNGSLTISTQDFKEAYKEFDRGAEKYRSIVAKEMVGEIRDVIPSVESKRWQENNIQVRGLVFPSLEDARKEFDESIGYNTNWED